MQFDASKLIIHILMYVQTRVYRDFKHDSMIRNKVRDMQRAGNYVYLYICSLLHFLFNVFLCQHSLTSLTVDLGSRILHLSRQCVLRHLLLVFAHICLKNALIMRNICAHIEFCLKGLSTDRTNNAEMWPKVWKPVSATE